MPGIQYISDSTFQHKIKVGRQIITLKLQIFNLIFKFNFFIDPETILSSCHKSFGEMIVDNPSKKLSSCARIIMDIHEFYSEIVPNPNIGI